MWRALLYGAGWIVRAHGSLGAFFAARRRASGSLRVALGDFVDELCAADFTPLLGQRGLTRGLKHLPPYPARSGACKRLNLFLRWMGRGADGVDLRPVGRAAQRARRATRHSRPPHRPL